VTERSEVLHDPRSDRQWVEAALDHFGYKPDWTFEVVAADVTSPSPYVDVGITRRDTVDSVRWIQEGSRYPAVIRAKVGVPDYLIWKRDINVFLDWIRREIQALEMHELDEFFHDPKTKKPFNDPHAPRR
jgi:hypothetical protein